MRPILDKDGKRKNPDIDFRLSKTAMRLAKIREEDWTQVITDPAKFTNGPLWR